MKALPIRQGDVYLVPAENPSMEGFTAVEAEVINGEPILTLQHGEATGHRHAFRAPEGLFKNAENAIRVQLLKEQDLYHGDPLRAWSGDHDTVKIPAGVYDVVIAREYQPEGWRRVED